MNRQQRRQYLIITAVLLVIVFLLGTRYGIHYAQNEERLLAQQSEQEMLYASITGAVRYPGHYRLSTSATLGDLLALAQPTDKADLHTLDEQQPLRDGESIAVPYQLEDYPLLEAWPSANPDNSDQGPNDKININTADAATLMELPGIGEVKAAAIIDYRQTHGPFADIREITSVKGIGTVTYNNIREMICVDEISPTAE